MKKLLGILGVLVALAAVGCGRDDDKKEACVCPPECACCVDGVCDCDDCDCECCGDCCDANGGHDQGGGDSGGCSGGSCPGPDGQ